MAWRDASVLGRAGPLGGMVPDPALLTPAHATELVRADGRPQPAFRDQLRTIPSWRNAWSVRLGVAPGRRSIVGLAVWWGNPVGYVARLPAHGSHAGAARVADARGRAPVAVRQPPRSTTSSVAGCSATRRSRRPTRTGACTWRTTVRSSGPTSPTSRCTPAIRSPARASAASWCATRPGRPAFKLVPRPGRRLPLVRRPCPAHAVEDPRGAGGPARRRDRGRRTGGCTRCSGLLPFLTVWRVINRLRSIAEHGGMDASPDRRATTHTVRQSWWARTVLVPFHIGWHLAHHVDAGVSMRHLPRVPPSAARCRVRHAGARVPRLPGAVAGTARGNPRFAQLRVRKVGPWSAGFRTRGAWSS